MKEGKDQEYVKFTFSQAVELRNELNNFNERISKLEKDFEKMDDFHAMTREDFHNKYHINKKD